MNSINKTFLFIALISLGSNVIYAYSNNSRGPYHHDYSQKVVNSNQQSSDTVKWISNADGTFQTAVDEDVSFNTVNWRSSAVRTYESARNNDVSSYSGSCFANLDYIHAADDNVSRRTSVLCQNQLTSTLVSKIQNSLNSTGYNSGPVTGQLNTKTLSALYNYQTARNLGAGAVTQGTLNSLGIRSF